MTEEEFETEASNEKVEESVITDDENQKTTDVSDGTLSESEADISPDSPIDNGESLPDEGTLLPEYAQDAETVFVAPDETDSQEPPSYAEIDENTEDAANADDTQPETDNDSLSDESVDGTTENNVTQTDKPQRFIDSIFDFLELLVFSLVAVLMFTTFFVRHSVVVGSSMEATLYENEHLIISDLFYTPERGDIIVCEDYSTNLHKPIVKRVIAVAGDHIEISANTVTVNGERLTEDYVYINGPLEVLEIDIVVPEGEIFVMGDHRNNSTDSRHFGTIDTDSVIGKVLFRFYPFDKFGKVE